ncbi:PDDEXK family nuclease [Marisediminicola senii]|uniref:hypothetical protein n=1 Tax=Marisediminicola senii TaxID=2711233 RepID=UPI0013EA968D|nr:hypothetical protein [Marisediminicola senii]
MPSPPTTPPPRSPQPERGTPSAPTRPPRRTQPSQPRTPTTPLTPTIADTIARHDYFLRRRDLLALGFRDGHIRGELARRAIFRVRQGWYSIPSAPDAAVRAVRVGGRLTGTSALESYGIPVPHRPRLQVTVAATACRLRNPLDRHRRLSRSHDVGVQWTGQGGSIRYESPWRVTVTEALAAVLRSEGRDVAVACADLALRFDMVTPADVATLFADAPRRTGRWHRLVDGRSDSHGETFVRLWLGDAGIRFEPQPRLAGVGRLDGRVSRYTYLEIDGSQHDAPTEGPVDAASSQFERDRHRDTVAAIDGKRVLRFTYRQLYTSWHMCLAAVRRAVADDARRELAERDAARYRKRRRKRVDGRNGGTATTDP